MASISDCTQQPVVGDKLTASSMVGGRNFTTNPDNTDKITTVIQSMLKPAAGKASSPVELERLLKERPVVHPTSLDGISCDRELTPGEVGELDRQDLEREKLRQWEHLHPDAAEEWGRREQEMRKNERRRDRSDSDDWKPKKEQQPAQVHNDFRIPGTGVRFRWP